MVSCLQSIESLELPPEVDGIEIIVVDNRSRDRTAEISRARGAIVELVEPGHPSACSKCWGPPRRG